MYNKKLKQNFIKKTKLKEYDDPLVVDEVLSDNEWIANPSDEYDEACEEDEIDVVCRAIGERGESSSSRKRKNVEVNLVDEDDDGLNSVDEDDIYRENDAPENDCFNNSIYSYLKEKRERWLKRVLCCLQLITPIHTMYLDQGRKLTDFIQEGDND
ncbi:unnamed protein product [Lactuca saligna]|uniref:Uncharacterized protein n=1 Tax=Lactuca saligna TaxID=75948 RepID=A0AA35Y418_LACSI|nr:unnamed protein product [Lactuca saligna]